MGTTHIDIKFEGNDFFPSVLAKETKWPLEILVEKGQSSPKGKFKGTPSPYGIALLKIDEELGKKDPIDILDEYTAELIKFQEALKKSGVEEIVFDIETSNSKEYNFTIESSIMKRLAVLNARIDFHGNETEIALDKWLETITSDLLSKRKYLSKAEITRFSYLRNRIVLSSPHIHVFNISNIYGFLLLYIIKYMHVEEENIRSFEEEYKEYNKNM